MTKKNKTCSLAKQSARQEENGRALQNHSVTPFPLSRLSIRQTAVLDLVVQANLLEVLKKDLGGLQF